MSYIVIPTPRFEKDIEYYESKGFDNIVDDINDDVVKELEKGNLIGDSIADMKQPSNHFVVKARAGCSDTKSGKSNGYRVIYYAIKNDKTIYLLTVYYKKDNRRIPTDKELRDLINIYCM